MRERRKRNMLNFQEFQEYVQMNLHEVLSDEYKNVVVALNEVSKNNGTVLHAVSPLYF